MKNRPAIAKGLAALLLACLLGGCATTYRSGADEGVYYERPTRTVMVAYADPLFYPYWSLDYFYYSRYYHPYSVVVHRYDPWYYPYPGWYYGYGHGSRHHAYGGRHPYPWHRYANRYAYYEPWRMGVHFGFDAGTHHDRGDQRVRVLDARLSALETRRSLAARGQRPERPLLLPNTSPWPASDRRAGDRGVRGSGPSTYGRSDREALLERLRERDRAVRDLRPVIRSRDGAAVPKPVVRPPRTTPQPVTPARESSAPRPSREPARQSSPQRQRPPSRSSREPARQSRREGRRRID